ncbi:hypothetical protein LTR78_002059 [Recurvomyces mirabilis]|uniref:Uncharacterized protein n=1 Tax=Recurvomyces mirabilis TaxID=574656 RepID=A0AAE0WUQ5_9PEZI|nr:hypothetical protein LTR78_002059 [Recurvomyces mirabilis]KAK5160517.1 hypothetical protein LTS14_001529 [Recurvomyces mirabilis]
MVTITADIDRLGRGMQTLPQELWTLVYDLVFTAEPRQWAIWPESRTPARTQIDSRSRKQFAAHYYGHGAKFVFDGLSAAQMARWLRSRHPQHLALLKHITFRMDTTQVNRFRSWPNCLGYYRDYIGRDTATMYLLDVLEYLGLARILAFASSTQQTSQTAAFLATPGTMTLRQYGFTSSASTSPSSNKKSSHAIKFAPRSCPDMTSPPIDLARLATQMQALPQELINAVYYNVFTPDQRIRIVWPESRLPARLQVDRHSREMFAARYYGGGAVLDFRNMDEDLLIKWLGSRSTAHWALLRHITFTAGRGSYHRTLDFQGGGTVLLRMRLLRRLAEVGIKDGENVLQVVKS